jgi:hypothetical protein
MIDDPRDLGGSISGPGGPYDEGQTLIDASKALIVHHHQVARIVPEEGSGGGPSFALWFEGRVNRTEDEARVVLLGGLDFLAALCVEAGGVAKRSGLGPDLIELINERLKELP